jgi:hypothetical protein
METNDAQNKLDIFFRSFSLSLSLSLPSLLFIYPLFLLPSSLSFSPSPSHILSLSFCLTLSLHVFVVWGKKLQSLDIAKHKIKVSECQLTEKGILLPRLMLPSYLTEKGKKIFILILKCFSQFMFIKNVWYFFFNPFQTLFGKYRYKAK